MEYIALPATAMEYIALAAPAPAIGAKNTGTTCHFNSLVQSLLSCAALAEFFAAHTARFAAAKNIPAMEYIALAAPRAAPLLDRAAPLLDRAAPLLDTTRLLAAVRAASPGKFGATQEDAGEGLHLFLGAINDARLCNLFTCRYRATIICIICRNGSERETAAYINEIPTALSPFQPTPGAHPLSEHIRQNGTALQGYTCRTCKKKGQPAVRIYQLIRAPAIFVIQFNKFRGKHVVDFPTTLTFPGIGAAAPPAFALIAKIEHAGGTTGGHYWAVARRGGAVYQFDDSRVSPGDLAPTAETYLLFYHAT